MADQAEAQIIETVAQLLQPFNRAGAPIDAQTDIMADLEIDSVAVLDVVMELEDRFDIAVPMDVMPKLRTVGDLAGAIQQIRAESK